MNIRQEIVNRGGRVKDIVIATLSYVLAINVHRDQKDKGGNEYIGHINRVALKSENVDEFIIGILHDVLEDSDMTIEDVAKETGITKMQINALLMISKNNASSDIEYYRNIESCNIATKVKINDLRDNMDLSRLKKVTAKDIERFKVYQARYIQLFCKLHNI